MPNQQINMTTAQFIHYDKSDKMKAWASEVTLGALVKFKLRGEKKKGKVVGFITDKEGVKYMKVDMGAVVSARRKYMDVKGKMTSKGWKTESVKVLGSIKKIKFDALTKTAIYDKFERVRGALTVQHYARIWLSKRPTRPAPSITHMRGSKVNIATVSIEGAWEKEYAPIIAGFGGRDSEAYGHLKIMYGNLYDSCNSSNGLFVHKKVNDKTKDTFKDTMLWGLFNRKDWEGFELHRRKVLSGQAKKSSVGVSQADKRAEWDRIGDACKYRPCGCGDMVDSKNIKAMRKRKGGKVFSHRDTDKHRAGLFKNKHKLVCCQCFSECDIILQGENGDSCYTDWWDNTPKHTKKMRTGWEGGEEMIREWAPVYEQMPTEFKADHEDWVPICGIHDWDEDDFDTLKTGVALCEECKLKETDMLSDSDEEDTGEWDD